MGRKCRFERRLLPHPHTPQDQTPAPFCHSGERRAPSFSIQSPSVRSDLPRVFTKVILPIGHLAHTHAVCLLQYLDDWILRNTDKSLLVQQTSWLLHIMRRVGLVLNVPKSQLAPTQRLIHIGVEYWLDVGLMFPPMDRVHKTESGVSLLLSVQVTTVHFWLSLLGRMSSATDAIPLGRLHLRPLQLYLLAHWSRASKDMAALIPVKQNLLDHHLHWWLNRKYTRAGMLLDIPEAQTQLFTDASESGWGAHSNTFQASGEWSAREAILHINQLEMLAVRNALAAFKTLLSGLTVQLMSDSAIVVSYIAKQGGNGSAPSSTGCEYLPSGQAHSGRTERTCGPSLQNEQSGLHGVDITPIRGGCTRHHLGQTQCGSVCDSTQPQIRCVCFPHGRPPIAVEVDAVSISWKGMYAYAFPPFVMLRRVIEKLHRDHPCEMILIAPKWPNQTWYVRLIELLVDFPLVLPLRKYLLTQPHNHRRHQSLQAVRLLAWRLYSDPSKRKYFLEPLPSKSRERGANPL